MEATMVVPGRTHEQRMAALGWGNEIRSYRAALKKDMAAKRVSAVDLLVADDPKLATMKVEELLLAIPGYGHWRVAKILRRLVISQSKTVGGLSDRQRAALVTALSGTMSADNRAPDC